jgi:predicted amidohydrolase
VRIGACQTPELLGDVDGALRVVEGFAAEATDAGVDLLLFPECFLQGYLVTERHVAGHAVEIGSAAFARVLDRLAAIRQTLVLGVIERSNGAYFNTAIVIRAGRVLGRYRKRHLTPGEAVFTAGDSYPVFDPARVRFGVNICYDTQFPAGRPRSRPPRAGGDGSHGWLGLRLLHRSRCPVLVARP